MVISGWELVGECSGSCAGPQFMAELSEQGDVIKNIIISDMSGGGGGGRENQKLLNNNEFRIKIKM